MNILIVDDDAYIIRAIKSQINWVEIGVDNVFTALNVSKAKEIIKESTIDIMVTDIEMPQENGLDLMRWVLKEGYRPESICLTCHAEFEFAREAIRLGYSEYCVKPIEFKEMEEILRNTVMRCRQKVKKNSMETGGLLWEKNRKVVAYDFWNNLILGKYEGNVEQIIKHAAQKKVEYYFDTQYICALFAVCSIEEKETAWNEDQGLMKYAINNILGEKFPKEESTGRIGWYEDYLWIILGEENSLESAKEFEDFLNVCKELLGIKLAAYVSDKVFGENLGMEFYQLVDLDMDNIRRSDAVYFSNLKTAFSDKEQENELLFEKYKKLIEESDMDTFFGIVIEDIRNKKDLNRETLENYIVNILQLLSSRLLFMNIQANALFHKEIILTLKKASGSVNGTLQLLEEFKIKMNLLSDRKKQESKIINEIKAYINTNIESKLTRKEIADKVFLSPDYLTKLFRKETGLTLIEYVTEEKINAAKRMIIQEKMQIGEVAGRLGYENFSYFSEIFRKKTGMLPSEYKRMTE
jgi:two-component system response regulator YesN